MLILKDAHQNKLKMKFKNKAIALETLLRVVIAIVLLFFILKIGSNALRGFTGSDAPEVFHEFVDDLNEMPRGSKQFVIAMDKESMVYGFNNETKEIECKSCHGILFEETMIYNDYAIEKPQHSECKDNSCICQCLSPIILAGKISCDRPLCRSVQGTLGSVRNFSSGVLNNEDLSKIGSNFVFARNSDLFGYIGYIHSDQRNLLLCAKKDINSEGKIIAIIGKSEECQNLK